jgi:hypothetical protein
MTAETQGVTMTVETTAAGTDQLAVLRSALITGLFVTGARAAVLRIPGPRRVHGCAMPVPDPAVTREPAVSAAGGDR